MPKNMSGPVGQWAREMAKESGKSPFMTNCVVSLIKQLWSGKLNDDLVRAASNGMAPWEEIKAIPYGVELGGIIRGRFSVISKKRPTSFPRGAAAISEAARHGFNPMPCQFSSGEEYQSSHVWGHMACRGEGYVSAGRQGNSYFCKKSFRKDRRIHEGLQSKNAEVSSGNFETEKGNCDGFYRTICKSKHDIKYDGTNCMYRIMGDVEMNRALVNRWLREPMTGTYGFGRWPILYYDSRN